MTLFGLSLTQIVSKVEPPHRYVEKSFGVGVSLTPKMKEAHVLETFYEIWFISPHLSFMTFQRRNGKNSSHTAMGTLKLWDLFSAPAMRTESQRTLTAAKYHRRLNEIPTLLTKRLQSKRDIANSPLLQSPRLTQPTFRLCSVNILNSLHVACYVACIIQHPTAKYAACAQAVSLSQYNDVNIIPWI